MEDAQAVKHFECEHELRAEMCRRAGVQYWHTQQCVDSEDEGDEEDGATATQASAPRAAGPSGLRSLSGCLKQTSLRTQERL